MTPDGEQPNPEQASPELAERRLNQLERETFASAVERATRAATQEVAQIHRRRLVTQTALVVVSVMAALGIAIIFIVANNTNNARRSNQVYNCQLLTKVAGIMSSFVITDATLRKQQALDQKQIAALRPGALKRLFQDPETTRLSKRSQRIDTQTTHYWEHTLIPQLQELASVNCPRKIT